MSSEKRKISSPTNQDSAEKQEICKMEEKQPPNTPKRPAVGEDDDEWKSVRQPKKLDELTEKEKQDILNEKFWAPEVEELDEATLERLILLFEIRDLRNQIMRLKFPDQPEKFMESEVKLHKTLQELQIVAATNLTNLYYMLMVELGAVPSLLELLSHENTDIAVGVVDLLRALTKEGILHEFQDADTLIDALLEQQVCALLVQNLERLDETGVNKEDSTVYNTIDIFEKLLEFRPDLCADAGKQGLMQWLLRRVKIKTKRDETNKCLASLLLSILLQDTPENRLLLGDLDGIDVLLQQLAYLQSHDPQTAQEHETNEDIMENLFNVLCSSLMATVNRDRFLRGGGLQLMNLMLREKKMSWDGSLKVLDHAMNGPDGKDNCSKFVDILGLQTIFPLFMKTPTLNRKRMLTAEKHVISIIASLLKNCKGQQRQTLLSYFTENDYEKVDRLMELHFNYLEKVEEVKKNGKDDEDEKESYSRRLDGGLFILQLVDYVLLEACTSEGCPPAVKERVTRISAQRSLKTIRHIMREYAGNLGDAGDTEWKEAEQQRILQLIEKF
ncbi:beta-catenin-like protein 1 isoform X2 [Temnothorax longispinosus]|uniref:beta-catenin-like protein 1 isoform X2 n=1 Tax=Temnothorax longispinosus TaxID=300112 RepID=UPI003A99AE82